MNAITLSAAAREDFGKGAARKLRAAGRVPALVYSQGSAATHLTVDPHELRLIFQKSGNPNTLLSLETGDTKHIVLLKASQKHPVSRDLLHIDFYQVDPAADITVEVPIKIVGRSKGEQLGGRLQKLRRTVPVTCLPEHIPACLEANVDHLEVDDFYRASDLAAPANTRLVYENDFNLLVCIGKKIELEEEVEEGEEGEEAEEATEESDK